MPLTGSVDEEGTTNQHSKLLSLPKDKLTDFCMVDSYSDYLLCLKSKLFDKDNKLRSPGLIEDLQAKPKLVEQSPENDSKVTRCETSMNQDSGCTNDAAMPQIPVNHNRKVKAVLSSGKDHFKRSIFQSSKHSLHGDPRY